MRLIAFRELPNLALNVMGGEPCLLCQKFPNNAPVFAPALTRFSGDMLREVGQRIFLLRKLAPDTGTVGISV
jgi:hypothetical protein